MHPGRRKGFTLIELLMTVVVATILAAVALPAYNNQIRKSRRTEARTALLDMAGRAERMYSTSNSYYGINGTSLVPTDLGYTGPWPVTVGSGYYRISLGNSSAATYMFTATAIGTQQADTTCATFSVDNAGNQTATDPTCWK
jgi:type IV pilus assembly protein PilE